MQTELVAGALAPLTQEDHAALEALYIKGTPANTLRAYERDLAYIAAWKQARLGAGLIWPESEEVALCFLLDHARDLREDPPASNARRAAESLIRAGLRRLLDCPAPSTLDRRIASWRAFHRMRNLASPFEAPLIRQARAKARRAAARPPARKSENPLTRDILEAMLAVCGPDLRGLRDRAMLMFGFASGGRRRSEIAHLHIADLDRREFAAAGLIRFRLLETKTTSKGEAPRLIIKGRAAQALEDWLSAAALDEGPVFRRISKAGRALKYGLTPEGVGLIVKARLQQAGYDPGFASAHGLRSGFLTQAARDGAPLQAAMRLSLHKSAAQAQRYYDDIEIADNPAADLLS